MAVLSYMQAHGEGVKTRDLLSVVSERGITIGGANEVATLSARLGTSKMFVLKSGHWFIKRVPTAGDEAAAAPAKDQSAASLFTADKGGAHGTTLAAH